MSIKFPYHQKQTEFGALVEPVVRVAIATPFGWHQFKFLVDSGADVSLLPLSAAEFLGVKVDKQKRTLIGGVEGAGVFGYPDKIKIKLADKVFWIRCFFVESEVPPLLGRLDIWDKFSLAFDNKKRQVVFVEIGPLSWRKRITSWFRGYFIR